MSTFKFPLQTTPEGLIYKDYEAGTGELPQGEQQVLFDYTAYNEAGKMEWVVAMGVGMAFPLYAYLHPCHLPPPPLPTAGVIDSSYRKNAIAKTRLGIGSLIPGRSIGIRMVEGKAGRSGALVHVSLGYQWDGGLEQRLRFPATLNHPPTPSGFEMGLKTMRVGGKRRIVVPPELGPPVGPATFFSAKQFEVFDVELRGTQNCRRRQTGFFSDVVCE